MSAQGLEKGPDISSPVKWRSPDGVVGKEGSGKMTLERDSRDTASPCVPTGACQALVPTPKSRGGLRWASLEELWVSHHAAPTGMFSSLFTLRRWAWAGWALQWDWAPKLEAHSIWGDGCGELSRRGGVSPGMGREPGEGH